MALTICTSRTWTSLLVLIFHPVQVYGVDSFCIADRVSLGEKGRVSCHFSEDLSITPQKDLNVYIYKASEIDPELVVFYFWVNGKPNILTEPGYDCNGDVTDHLEVLISNATKEHEGIYKCLVAPSIGSNSKTCTLVIEDKPIYPNSRTSSPDLLVEDQGIESSCTASSVSVGKRGLITFRFSKDLSIPPPKDVKVFLKKESAIEQTPVLWYAWRNGSPCISMTPGYICNGKLTDQLQITVYNATEQHAGHYRSEIYHSKHKSNSCMVHVMEERSADVTQNYNHIVPIVLGCLVLLAAIIIIAIFIIIKEFRLQPQRWNNSSKTTESASESEEGNAERESLQGNNGVGV